MGRVGVVMWEWWFLLRQNGFRLRQRGRVESRVDITLVVPCTPHSHRLDAG
jgi:hypothetical protein